MMRHALTGALVIFALAAMIIVGSDMRATGSLTEVAPLELGEANAPIGVRTRGALTENADGYRVGPGGQAVVIVSLTMPQPDGGRTLLRVWAYGPDGVRTTAVVRAADGSERTLGRAFNWVGQTFDVTEEARLGGVQVRVRGENSTDQPVLFLDRLAPIVATGTLQPGASPGAVGLLVLLLTSALLALAGRLLWHWPLAFLLAVVAAVLWRDAIGGGTAPVTGEGAAAWQAALQASWFGFDDGLLSGAWVNLSSLAVQALHAFSVVVGTAPAACRSAAVLTTLTAIAIVYAVGFRAAGRLGAIVAALLVSIALDLHDIVATGSTVPVLVAAAGCFTYVLHAAVAQATRSAICALAAAAALLMLADPAWLPGAVLAVLIVGWWCSERAERLGILRVGLLAVIVSCLPHLVSVAGQNDGRLFAAQQARAAAAHRIEFLAPGQPARDSPGEPRVTFSGYLFGDHSVVQFVGGALSGAQESVSAYTRGGRSALLGATSAALFGAAVLFVLLLPRLRLLVLLAPLVAAPTLFIAARTHSDPVPAGAVMLPAMLACIVILGHAVGRLLRAHVEPYAVAAKTVVARRRSPPSGRDRDRRDPSAT